MALQNGHRDLKDLKDGKDPELEMGVINPAFTSSQDDIHKLNGKGLAPDHEADSAVDDEEPPANRCGWWILRPDFLQRFRTAKWALFWLCWAGAVQGMVVNGFVNVVITTIERRFGLRSSQTGLVAGGYDVASFICLIPVTYLGGRPGASKPRWLGWGVLMMSVGSLMFAAPHFLVGPYRGASHTLNTCRSDTVPPYGDTACDVVGEGAGAGNSGPYMWLFLAGQLLHGAGAAPLFTLGVTFIDENVSKKMSSVYLGIYYTTAVIGPALGYVIGGQLLLLYTDFWTVDPAQLGLTPLSNVWVGAWWVGFIAAAVVCLFLAIPLFAYPVELPGAAAIRAEKVSEAHGSTTTTEAFSKLREMPRAFRALITNPTFFFLNLAGASEGLLLAGFAAFLPKLIENQFSVSASKAALFMGLVTVPAGGGGTFLGGYLVKRLALNCAAIIKLCIITAALGVVFTMCFFISCPNIAFAGVTRGYGDTENGTGFSTAEGSLISACNTDCRCHGVDFDPVCGADNVMYYSPCHAGCKKEITLDAARVYSNCSCVNAHNAIPPEERSRRRRYVSPGEDPEEDGEEGAFSLESRMGGFAVEYDAINEPCTTSCDLLWVFIGLAFFTMLVTFLVTMPALTATLRCVQDEQRSFALGIQWIKVRLLGTIPAPMIFGLLIDETCVLWQREPCSEEAADSRLGNCLAYDNLYMSRYMLTLAFLGKLCSLIFFFLAWWLYRPPPGLLDAAAEPGSVSPTAPKDPQDEAHVEEATVAVV